MRLDDLLPVPTGWSRFDCLENLAFRAVDMPIETRRAAGRPRRRPTISERRTAVPLSACEWSSAPARAGLYLCVAAPRMADLKASQAQPSAATPSHACRLNALHFACRI